MTRIIQGDNLEVLKTLPDNEFSLIYIDPPYNTGKTQKGRSGSYGDTFDSLSDFLEPRLVEAHRVLHEHGSIFVHLDYREVHYVKVLMDQIFGRENFKNEIIWAYDYGARSKTRWPTKHDNILWYTKTPDTYTFNYDEMDRVPYMAPGLVGPEKAAKGKTPTDVWWQTVVPTNGPERTGYPTQKPVKLLERIIKIHSKPGDKVLDFFAGSGTTGVCAQACGRDGYLIDANPEAIKVMEKRLGISAG